MSKNMETYTFDQHLNDVREYPYTCPYLYHLLKQDRRPTVCADEILAIVMEMEDWLCKNVTGKGVHNYQWSIGALRTEILNRNGSFVKFSNSLRFRYQEDLLAFKLRFNIHG